MGLRSAHIWALILLSASAKRLEADSDHTVRLVVDQDPPKVVPLKPTGKMNVTVPKNASEGDIITVTTPNENKIAVTIPEGTTEGTNFSTPYFNRSISKPCNTTTPEPIKEGPCLPTPYRLKLRNKVNAELDDGLADIMTVVLNGDASIASVVEVGCSRGLMVKSFYDAGILDAKGLDPTDLEGEFNGCTVADIEGPAAEDTTCTGAQQLFVDVLNETSASSLQGVKYDVAMCLDFAQFVHKVQHRVLLDWLGNHTSKWLVFSAAITSEKGGQGGDSLVTERPLAEYQEEFALRKLVYHENMTKFFRWEADSPLHQNNLLVYHTALDPDEVRKAKGRAGASWNGTFVEQAERQLALWAEKYADYWKTDQTARGETAKVSTAAEKDKASQQPQGELLSRVVDGRKRDD